MRRAPDPFSSAQAPPGRRRRPSASKQALRSRSAPDRGRAPPPGRAVPPSRSAKDRRSGGPMIHARSASGGAARPRAASAERKQPTMPSDRVGQRAVEIDEQHAARDRGRQRRPAPVCPRARRFIRLGAKNCLSRRRLERCDELEVGMGRRLRHRRSASAATKAAAAAASTITPRCASPLTDTLIAERQPTLSRGRRVVADGGQPILFDRNGPPEPFAPCDHGGAARCDRSRSNGRCRSRRPRRRGVRRRNGRDRKDGWSGGAAGPWPKDARTRMPPPGMALNPPVPQPQLR